MAKETTEQRAPEKKKGFWRRLPAIFLLLVLLAAATLYAIPLFEGDKGGSVDGSNSWMSRVEDSRPLSRMAIPGTHDAGTQYVQLAFFAKCQTKDIAEQLEAGYRYLDIRLAVDGEHLKLMHGFTNCKTGALPWSGVLYLDKVLQQCYVFLENHPTETVLFAVKQEHGKESVAEFQRLLDSYVQQNPSRWLLTDTVPTLGQARGKIVLLRRYDDEAGLGKNAGIPLLWAEQSGSKDTNLSYAVEDNGSYRLYVQDRYCYNVEEKWTAFLAGLDAGDAQAGDVKLSFLSTKGTLPLGHPYTFADALNPRLIGRDIRPEDGWIVIDFGTAPIAKHIYEANFD